MAAHPAAGAAFGTVATPDSFADEEYYGIDPFVSVDAAGHRQAVRYQIVPEKLVHIAPGDPTADPTKPWPDTNKVVDLETLTITNVVPDSMAAQKALLFLRGRLTDGIDFSDDQLVQTRDGTYAVSFSRRIQ
jgi:catalase